MDSIWQNFLDMRMSSTSSVTLLKASCWIHKRKILCILIWSAGFKIWINTVFRDISEFSRTMVKIHWQFFLPALIHVIYLSCIQNSDGNCQGNVLEQFRNIYSMLNVTLGEGSTIFPEKIFRFILVLEQILRKVLMVWSKTVLEQYLLRNKNLSYFNVLHLSNKHSIEHF